MRLFQSWVGLFESEGAWLYGTWPRLFPPAVFSLQCWCYQTGGHRKSKGRSLGFLLSLFCFVLFLFLTVNFVKQATKLHIRFLLVLPHDVNSFHSYRFCGELITLNDPCKEGMSGCITVFSRAYFFVFLEPLGGAGWLDIGVRKVKAERRVSAAKFYLTQQKQKTTPRAKQHSGNPSLCPP